jgi:Zn-dependent protease
MASDLGLGIGLFGILVLSLAVHEFGHAWTARKLGDPTAERLGRVTLNPIPHLDPVFSVVLPLAMILSGSGYIFGAGKPVPVNDRNLRHPTRDMLLISTAGPFMNVVLALCFTGLGHVLYHVAGITDRSVAGILLYNAIGLNFILAAFNLLPVPPLDGHRVLGFFLPRPVREVFYRAWWLGLVVLFLLIFQGGWTYLRRWALIPFADLYEPLMPPTYPAPYL